MAGDAATTVLILLSAVLTALIVALVAYMVLRADGARWGAATVRAGVAFGGASTLLVVVLDAVDLL